VKQWVVATDRALPAAPFRGQFAAVHQPDVDGYAIGDWIEVVVSEEPRRVWRLLCEERDAT
jgi:hypothetical protein